MIDSLKEFIDYHNTMYRIGDIDPSYPMLRYVCDRFELNMEQRYWLAFLYSTCYCGSTVYYIYNEFPDFENVDVGRLTRWWNKNKDKCVFQTDRKWIKLRNQFVDTFVSYRNLIAGRKQEDVYKLLKSPNDYNTYQNCYDYFSKVKHFGRFTLFIYLESVYVVTDFPMKPVKLDFTIDSSEACRNGLVYALNRKDLLTGKKYKRKDLPIHIIQKLQDKLIAVMNHIKKNYPEQRTDIWNVETSLCAFKKWKQENRIRYPGYYLDRQLKEIQQVESAVTVGVDWSVLYDFRRETFEHPYLMEITGRKNYIEEIHGNDWRLPDWKKGEVL